MSAAQWQHLWDDSRQRHLAKLSLPARSDPVCCLQANENIIVMAATNLSKALDPALTRPGRFDRHVAVPMPDVSGRLEIIQHFLKVGLQTHCPVVDGPQQAPGKFACLTCVDAPGDQSALPPDITRHDLSVHHALI